MNQHLVEFVLVSSYKYHDYIRCAHCEVFHPWPSSSVYAVGVGPASIMVGNLVAGKRIAQATGRELGMIEDQDLIRKVQTTH